MNSPPKFPQAFSIRSVMDLRERRFLRLYHHPVLNPAKYEALGKHRAEHAMAAFPSASIMALMRLRNAGVTHTLSMVTIRCSDAPQRFGPIKIRDRARV